MIYYRIPGIIWILVLVGCNTPSHYPSALSPQDALQSFDLREGFRIETFAAEPYIADPVEMVFDEKGNLYVVEMPDYPYKPKPDEARSRVRMLEDTDGDGRIDKSVIFADGLMEATSALPWKGGLLVCSAPNIFYLKDTDGDHIADLKDVLFTGFFEENPEVQITNLRYGLDNWIYAANFGRSGTITSPAHPEMPAVEVMGADFRFRLEPFQFEPTTGPTQFGHDQDDWGHRVVTQNSAHARHLVIPRRYLIQNPLFKKKFAIQPTYEDGTRMYQVTPPPYWRAVRTQRRQKNYDEQGTGRVEHDSQHFTGCSGTTFYLGDGFPDDYYGTLFTGEVAGNLVHRDLFIPSDESPTFRTRRPDGETDREFLASSDPWFRPANFTVGPDGYLYVTDMYRQHIETPLSIPEDLKLEMDFYEGDDRGRIYRILPTDSASLRKVQIDQLNRSNTDLLALLAHKNRWYRLQAQRLIVERQAVELTSDLREMANNHPAALGRIHALYCLEGIGGLDQEIIIKALSDPHPGLRENAIRLGEEYPEAMKRFPAMTKDPSPHVALQAVLSIGAGDFPNKPALLAKIADKRVEDQWFRMAVLCGLNDPAEAEDLQAALNKLNNFADDSTAAKKELFTSIRDLIEFEEAEENE